MRRREAWSVRENNYVLSRDVDGELPGHTFRRRGPAVLTVKVAAVSDTPLDRIELVVNGEVTRTLIPPNLKTDAEGYEGKVTMEVRPEASSWLVVRAFEKRPGGRVRFAHSSPVFIDIDGKPLRPRAREVEYLIERVQAQIKRSQGVLPSSAIAEYEKALV